MPAVIRTDVSFIVVYRWISCYQQSKMHAQQGADVMIALCVMCHFSLHFLNLYHTPVSACDLWIANMTHGIPVTYNCSGNDNTTGSTV